MNGQKKGRGIFSFKKYLASHQSVFGTLKHIIRDSVQLYKTIPIERVFSRCNQTAFCVKY